MFGKKKEVKKEPVSSPSTGRVQRMVPELATLSYTVTGNRQYQQDAFHVQILSCFLYESATFFAVHGLSPH